MKKYYMVIRKSTAKPIVLFDRGEDDRYEDLIITTRSKSEAISIQKELSDLYPDEEYVLKSFYL